MRGEEGAPDGPNLSEREALSGAAQPEPEPEPFVAGARIRMGAAPKTLEELAAPAAIELGELCAGELWGELLSARGERVAVGVVNYDAEEMRAIQGAKSSAIVALLGHTYGAEAIHRNNMAVL